MSSSYKHIHFVGVGGMGMAPLAIYFSQLGVSVSGEDDALTESLASLLDSCGIRIISAQCLKAQKDAAVVYTSALSASDERLLYLKDLGYAVYRRGEMLAEVAKDKKLLAVVGSHGKTTTAAMLATMLMDSGCDYILGGLFRGNRFLPSMARGGAWLIAEIDESDGTIELFSPECTLVLNLDWDHPKYYQSEGDMTGAFHRLFERTKDRLILPSKSECLDGLNLSVSANLYEYGENSALAYECLKTGINSCRIGFLKSWRSGEALIAAGGAYNAQNAAAAFAATFAIGEKVENDALSDFPGVYRRQEVLIDTPSLRMMMDYAHHPSEIEAFVRHIRESVPGQILMVFQPHRYSRTRQYASAFARALQLADHVILLPVYAASEAYASDAQSDLIFKQMSHRDGADRMVKDYAEMAEAIRSMITAKTSILFVGAGDIESMACRFVSERDVALGQWYDKMLSCVSDATRIKSEENLGKKTTIRLGGKARFYAEPSNVDDLCALLQGAREACMPVFVLGRGSNLLVSDQGFDGLVIHLKHDNWRQMVRLGDDRIEAGAGVRLQALSAKACKWGIAGFEFLEGIPGSIGGALRMNAGAMGGWMFDVVESIECVTLSGERMHFSAEECHYGYRHCKELLSAIATKAVLRSSVGETCDPKERMSEFSAKRVESQPREPSAGCIFKNPENGHAGQIIDELGLKGCRIGGAEVSQVHGNFIINRGDARCADVLELVKHIRQSVKEKKGVDLEPEVLLVGASWEEVL